MVKISLGFTLLVLMVTGCTTLPDDAIDSIKADTYTYYNSSDGLLDSEVLSVFEDKSGNIWIGTYYGVNKYDGNSFESFTPNGDGLITGAIVAIGQDYDGAIWVGSSDGYSVLENNVWDTESGFGLTSFYLDKEDFFWIGTETFGALQLSEAGLEIYSVDNCELCNFVTAFTEDASGKLWFATLSGAFKVTNKSTQAVQQYTMNNGLASDYLTSLLHDQWGNIWFGTYDADAISKFADNKFANVFLPTGFTEISGFSEGKKGIYVTTRELGFLYYDGAVVSEIKTPQEDYYLNCITKDSKGNFWIGTYDNGLIKFTPKSDEI
jgi:ligand-binding sensor domain-containing protein